MIGRATLLLPACLLLGGCLGSEQSVTWEEGGGGHLEQTVVVDVAAQRALLAGLLDRVAGGTLQEGEVDPFAGVWLRAAARPIEGFAWEEVRTERADGRRTTHLRARFETLEAAARAGAFFTSDVRLERLERPPSWRLTFTEGWRARIRERGDLLAGRPLAELRPLVERAAAGFVLERRLVVPGRVLETNGTRTEGGGPISWTLRLADLDAAQAPAAWVVVEATEANAAWFPFQHRVDEESLARRLVEPAPPERPAPPPLPDEEPGPPSTGG